MLHPNLRPYCPSRSPCGERGLKWADYRYKPNRVSGRSPCGERGLKSPRAAPLTASRSRSPCGERGLKCRQGRDHHPAGRSLPLRGAWIEIATCNIQNKYAVMSLPLRGAWIEMFLNWMTMGRTQCRSPCGERGLKSAGAADQAQEVSSLPLRGAWIEITSCLPAPQKGPGRSPCGERGLKLPKIPRHYMICCRSPCGERGLKYSIRLREQDLCRTSLPLRGAWIEIDRWSDRA